MRGITRSTSGARSRLNAMQGYYEQIRERERRHTEIEKEHKKAFEKNIHKCLKKINEEFQENLSLKECQVRDITLTIPARVSELYWLRLEAALTEYCPHIFVYWKGEDPDAKLKRLRKLRDSVHNAKERSDLDGFIR